ncbi:helix-turn-helix domain-containing protein [Leuconostoc citreum]|uniref:helix-turn-helix domain-containing protein n=1 Tax=Leuconostoc citreum TaxID=33964 RepID=UPI0002465986|nr:helix-turn-helix transcriptional regulator [Leuconostoc citreum]MBU7449996.1 helix-turn-helix transcriptional regulator [Leuconostoc citreum]MCP1275467.1 helix-turn-helix transcriptional regulator [Leuconostoc citreum]MCT3077189.1 XRE family transcriptional regulator [Leuconostoc citreum]QQE97564.1 helix-turn-helix transcriptional regulator [Leuconostoc citreum]TOY70760.1 XRE family transcriptional regulator [Leuconostoc citreum]
MALIDRVKEVSKKNGYSLTDVAIKAGIGEKSIYAWTKREPTVATLQKVADVLNVSTDYLLGRTDEMNYSSISENKQIDLKDALNDEIMLAFDGRDIPETDKVKIREYIELLDLKRRSEHE